MNWGGQSLVPGPQELLLSMYLQQARRISGSRGGVILLPKTWLLHKAAAVLPPASSSKSQFCNQGSKGSSSLLLPGTQFLAIPGKKEPCLERALSRDWAVLSKEWGGAGLLMNPAASCRMLLGIPLPTAHFAGPLLGRCGSQDPSSHSLELGRHFLPFRLPLPIHLSWVPLS